MVEVYEEDEVMDILMELLNFVESRDPNFEIDGFENSFLTRSLRDKTRDLCTHYGRDVEQYKNDVNFKSRGLVIESELDDEFVADVIEYIEENDLSRSESLGGLKLQSNSAGGRPSKVDKWSQLIESGDATLDEAKSEMSEPTWYKLKKRVEE